MSEITEKLKPNIKKKKKTWKFSYAQQSTPAPIIDINQIKPQKHNSITQLWRTKNK